MSDHLSAEDIRDRITAQDPASTSLTVYAVRLPAPDEDSFDVYVVGGGMSVSDLPRQPLQLFTSATQAHQRAQSMGTPTRGEYEVVAVPIEGDTMALPIYAEAARLAERRVADRLTTQTAQITRLQEALRASQQNHQEDIDAIADRLMTEANERNWCSEYDSIVADLNRSLHVELAEREYEFQVTETYTVTVRTTTTARTADDAMEYEFDDDEIIEAVREGRYELDQGSTRVTRVTHD